MTCYKPVPARRADSGGVVIWPELGTSDMAVPCGFCVGCLLEKRQQWSLRCRHEASCWDFNYFLTLTYEDGKIGYNGKPGLDWRGSLDKEHPKLFLRYLRRRVSGASCAPGKKEKPIRVFGCGEYGSQRQRAHYHMLLFNVQFTDTERYGERTFTSKLVSELWPFGSHLLGDVTPESASYVAGYALKKVEAIRRDSTYGVVDLETGECAEREREFNFCSTKPGIGQFWYERFKDELRHGYCIMDGRQVSVPRFYDKKLRVDAPGLYEEMSFRKYQKGKSFSPADRTEARLGVRENVVKARQSFFSSTHLED